MTYTPGKFDWKKANALNGYSGVQEAMGDFNSRLTNTINKGKGFAKNPTVKTNEQFGICINEEFYYRPGMEYKADGKFSSIVVHCLNYIYENGTPWFIKCIDSLYKNPRLILTIFETTKYGMNKCDKGREPHIDIDFNLNCAILAKSNGSNGSNIIPPFISLAHEISHAYRYLNIVLAHETAKKGKNKNLTNALGKKKSSFFKDPPDEIGQDEENFTTMQEKELCEKLGLAYRSSYNNVLGVAKVEEPFSIVAITPSESEQKEIDTFNKSFNK